MPSEQYSAGYWSQYRWLLLALAWALALQCAVVWNSPVISKDGTVFIQIARRMATGEFDLRDDHQHPGYPYLICLTHEFFFSSSPAADNVQSWIAAGRLVNSCFGLLGICAIWWFVREIHSDSVADVAALLCAALPILRQNAADVLSDTSHWVLYVLAACAAARGFLRGGAAWFAVCGLLSGIAFWIRPEGVTVGTVTGVVLVFGMWRAGEVPRRQRVWQFGALSIALLAVSVPYIWQTGTLSQKIHPKKNYAVVANFVHEQIQTITPDAVATKAPPSPTAVAKKTRQEIRDIPALVAGVGRQTLAGVAQLGKELMQRLHVLLLLTVYAAAVGALSETPRAVRRWMAAIAGFHCLLLIALFLLAGYLGRRNLIPLTLVILPAAAAGLRDYAQRAVALLDHYLRWSLGVFASSRIWLRVLVFAAMVGMAPRAARPLNQAYLPQWQAAGWLKSYLRPGDHLVTNAVFVPFYAETSADLIDVRREAPLVRAMRTPRVSARTIVALDVGDGMHFDRRWLGLLQNRFHVTGRVFGRGKGSSHTILFFEDTHGVVSIKQKGEAFLELSSNPIEAMK